MQMTKRIRAFAGTFCVLFPGLCFGYGLTLHQFMSQTACVMSQSLANDLPFSEWALKDDQGNLADINTLQFPRLSDSSLLFPDELISLVGARDEDNGTRARNHFYDPVQHIPLTIGPLKLGETSPDWAISGKGQPSPSFSYTDARKAMLLGLTGPALQDRNAKLGLMFETLGHVVHHMQDMAQPQHVRNEAHATLGIPAPFDLPTYSRYEAWAENQDYLSNVTFDSYESVYLSSPLNYWTNGDQSGIADFTSSNFVSQWRNFEMIGGDIQVAPPYTTPPPLTVIPVPMKSILRGPPFNCPRPSDANANPTSADARCSLGLDGEVDFVTTEVIDNLTGEAGLNSQASMYSIFDQDLQAVDGVVNNGESGVWYVPNSQMRFTVNALTFPSATPWLLPRAVGYSAGLIDYFFRGKIDLEPHVLADGSAVPDAFDIVNLGDEPLTGTVQLYYDDANGNRYPVVGVGKEWPMTVTNLAPKPPANSTDTSNRMLAPAIPAQSPEPFKAGVYMLVFNGTMGAEAPIGDGPGAVVAKLVKVPLPEIYWSWNGTFDSDGTGNPPLSPGSYGDTFIAFKLSTPMDAFFLSNFANAHVKINGTDYVPEGSPYFGCSLPGYPRSYETGATGSSSWWGAQHYPLNQVWYSDMGASGTNLMGNADDFMIARSASPNIVPICSNNIQLGFINGDKNTSVEYLLGTTSVFKFCVRIDPALNPYDLHPTAVLSHLQGARVIDGAIDIRVESPPLTACPGY